MNTQVLSATKARNNFFQLLDQAHLENKTFIIKKGNIPVAQISPPSSKTQAKTNWKQLIKQSYTLRKSMNMTSNSVEMIRQDRLHGH